MRGACQAALWGLIEAVEEVRQLDGTIKVGRFRRQQKSARPLLLQVPIGCRASLRVTQRRNSLAPSRGARHYDEL